MVNVFGGWYQHLQESFPEKDGLNFYKIHFVFSFSENANASLFTPRRGGGGEKCCKHSDVFFCSCTYIYT
jgi:hypothetical protein